MIKKIGERKKRWRRKIKEMVPKKILK